MNDTQTFTAFDGQRQIAHGELAVVAAAACATSGQLLILEDSTGQTVELDLRQGPEAAVTGYRARTEPAGEPPARPGRGRPKLGVVAREVTLLPRHWDWLAAQPGGASAVLRRLVEEARKAGAGPEQARRRQETVYRVMTVLAGDLPGFEEASRALFAGDAGRFDGLVDAWPAAVAAYLRRLAQAPQD